MKDSKRTICPYVYKVDWYDDFDEKERKEMGLIFGRTYKEAIDILGRWYGDHLINKIEIEAIEDGPIPIQTEAAYELLRREKIIT